MKRFWDSGSYSEWREKMSFGKTLATFALGAALGGAVVYGLADNVQYAVQRVPIEQRYTVNYKAGTPFLESVQNGKRLQLHQGKEGPVFDSDYVVASTTPAELERIVKKGLGNLPEEKQVEITIYGLRELEENNRAAAIESGLDYCKPETEADIAGRRLTKIMGDGYRDIREKIKEFYKDLREKITDPLEGGVENGDAQNSN